jgi:uncharacterized repeat protein (TIGR03803 family)
MRSTKPLTVNLFTNPAVSLMLCALLVSAVPLLTAQQTSTHGLPRADGTQTLPPTATYTVIHNFTGGRDGAYPAAGLTMDAAGDLYGTTAGPNGAFYGSVFRMRPHNGSWLFAQLYDFTGGADGADPAARVVIGPNGSLYGTTNTGGCCSNFCTGTPGGCGVVFNLRPGPTAPPTPLTPWKETVLHSFQGGTDGAYPGYGEVVFDQSGNIYDTTYNGGPYQCDAGGLRTCGVVYELTPSGGSYTESVIYSFTGGTDNGLPLGAVAFDNSGRLYTTSSCYGLDCFGSLIQLTPSGGGWSESTIYQFSPSSGAYPWAGVVIDTSGNLYGTTSANGSGNDGIVYELMPSGGSWTYSILEDFPGNGYSYPGPHAAVLRDSAGNLYGTTLYEGAHQAGNIFKLAPSGGGYTYTDLYDFTGASDGGNPSSNVVMDSGGNLYGTASQGGTDGFGVVWKLTP